MKYTNQVYPEFNEDIIKEKENNDSEKEEEEEEDIENSLLKELDEMKTNPKKSNKFEILPVNINCLNFIMAKIDIEPVKIVKTIFEDMEIKKEKKTR